FKDWWPTAERLTLPVDSMEEGRSPEGCHHMSGNVAEWVNDWYDNDYYMRARDKVVNKNPPGPEAGAQRVARGGSWVSRLPEWLTATARMPLDPATRALELGFRCARDVEVKKEKEPK
ncbi:SUMF1/EgtB/PvdO family nonheme iron enzyme, partial [bacterium]|nr:SUMF1/EgtB/PvdO family nonheme iron enzyme [bacterium]